MPVLVAEIAVEAELEHVDVDLYGVVVATAAEQQHEHDGNGAEDGSRCNSGACAVALLEHRALCASGNICLVGHLQIEARMAGGGQRPKSCHETTAESVSFCLGRWPGSRLSDAADNGDPSL